MSVIITDKRAKVYGCRTKEAELSGLSPLQLQEARRELGLNKVELANRLKTPYRTYVDWERGVTRIPGVAEVVVELLLEKDRRFMARVRGRESDQ